MSTVRACGWCGKPVVGHRADAIYCRASCRAAAHKGGIRRELPPPRWVESRCTDCSREMWAPVGAAKPPTCHGCRAAARIQRAICPDCAGIKNPASKRCRKCAGQARRIRPDDDHRSTRRDRVRAAPGLGQMARLRLLRRWVRQGRTCTYCDGPTEAVDHVIPLIRGGSNFEGNLTPACRKCNSAKRSHLLVEWRARLAA